ncbi:hypothetical protein M1446_05530 [Candidatus Dependentiae bacterium]|nr:hypothetical protein [Candidatus Dependentiae bacterium]
MAAPIMHVVFALKIFLLLPPTVDKKEFIVGTSFPDIRYYANLSRESTHIEPASWNDIVNEPSSFRAGMLFHNLLDILRMENFEINFFNRYALSQYTPLYIRLFPLIMKFAEDVVLYDKIERWQEIINYFDVIFEEEKKLCNDENIIESWHKILQNYFKQKPTFTTLTEFLMSQHSTINLWEDPINFNPEQIFDLLVNKIIFQKKLNDFYDNFENYLSNEPLMTKDVKW